ncbi:MAG TPA: hypothetical protein DEQ32_04140 [Gammaproteobacteria bacterium]|nr:hypothetical protein [Gammaproteobacteria bacterium]|tara:strand:+ start:75 stop:503 length:429 start_codon:yes stop_codon:yes gene_type:complete
MKLIFGAGLTLFWLAVSSLANAFEVDGDELNLNGSISSITLTESGGEINVVSDNERYGKTWLTYNLRLSNPNSSDQGSFAGRATAIDADGNRASSIRQGVWSRSGHVYSFMSLDDASDGNQYLCITEMDLMTDKVEMRFYPK